MTRREAERRLKSWSFELANQDECSVVWDDKIDESRNDKEKYGG